MLLRDFQLTLPKRLASRFLVTNAKVHRSVRETKTFSELLVARKGEFISELKYTRPPELVREFISDCLYNERDGYFQKHVNILSTKDASIPFTELKDQDEYNSRLDGMYKEQTKGLQFFQLWHTPSELFRPWFGRSIAGYIQTRASVKDPIVIYEVGPGNGTLCDDICNFFKDTPIFNRLEYHLIEVSRHLVESQLRPLQKKYPNQLHIHNCSFLEWKKIEHRPAFILAIEMFDNLPQDRIRFADDGSLEQAMVVTNDQARYGDEQKRFTEIFVPATDSLLVDTVNAMDASGYSWPSLQRSLKDSLLDSWPLTAFEFPRPWKTEFIPTGPFSFIKTLVTCFPHHSLVMTDFDSLPDTISGHGSPVVQTRYKGETVACSTYLLQRGLFDIFFPQNFSLLAAIHQHLTVNGKSEITKHADFYSHFVDTNQTRTMSGYNPALEDFANVSFLLANSN